MKLSPLLLSFLLTTLLLAGRADAQTTSHANSNWFFGLRLTKGEKVSNIFSRTIAYHGEDFTDLVQRVSGSATYTVTDDNPLAPVFEDVALYDGRPESKASYMIKSNGQCIYNGKTYQDASASGLLFNSLVWGVPPRLLREGANWENTILQAWELGGAGKQTVTIMQLDRPNHAITLKRQGNSEGFYEADAKQITVTLKDGKKVKMDIVPGRSDWRGYTTFRNGVVISDELLVTRPITLKNDSLGLNFSARQREYILLNAMPE